MIDCNDWLSDLADAVTDLPELCRILGLSPEVVSGGQVAADQYPLFVPRPFLDRMEHGNPRDPLLLQILPQNTELAKVDHFSDNPLGEFCVESLSQFNSCVATPSVLKKYDGRALVLTTERCGVHCRFCFRRHFPKSGEPKDFRRILDPIRSDRSIQEIILSGGDPLLLDDEELNQLFHYIVEIPHVKRIRLHSRLPIVLPNRLTTELIDILSSFSPVYLVLHTNHPNELCDDLLHKLQELKRLSGVSILTQTVLLKGINDDVDVLFRLFDRLIDHGIIPYYLHQLDRVSGAAHFEVSPEKGKKLILELQARLPGYAVPKYVRETVNSPSKTSV